jgi:hypothetical protein
VSGIYFKDAPSGMISITLYDNNGIMIESGSSNFKNPNK